MTLAATQKEIEALLHTARTSENPYADVLDCLCATLWASDPEDAYRAAEDTVAAAARLRDMADAALLAGQDDTEADIRREAVA